MTAVAINGNHWQICFKCVINPKHVSSLTDVNGTAQTLMYSHAQNQSGTWLLQQGRMEMQNSSAKSPWAQENRAV